MNTSINYLISNTACTTSKKLRHCWSCTQCICIAIVHNYIKWSPGNLPATALDTTPLYSISVFWQPQIPRLYIGIWLRQMQCMTLLLTGLEKVPTSHMGQADFASGQGA